MCVELLVTKLCVSVTQEMSAHVVRAPAVRTMAAAPHMNYISNRQGALASAMVAAAAITMPRQDGALRGTVESQVQAMSNAAEANTMASAALSATAAAAIAAVPGA